jgi:agmatine/peptidylarginine deiminase
MLAEWEHQRAIQLIFPHEKSDWSCCLEEIEAVYIDLITTIAVYEAVYIICDNIERVKVKLADHTNLHFFQANTDDTWARDTSFITIKTDKSYKLLNFTFNSWGDKYGATHDNAMNTHLITQPNYLPYSYKSIDFVLEGGAIETDGNGTLMVHTDTLLNPNRNGSMRKEAIEKSLQQYLQVNKVLFVTKGHIQGDDTDSHIDTLARFIDEKTIVYQDESMQEELETFGYNLLKLPTPNPVVYDGRELPATYANFLFINGALLLPTYNDPIHDQQVISLFKNLLPDHKIIPFDATILIRQNGSIHCATMQLY